MRVARHLDLADTRHRHPERPLRAVRDPAPHRVAARPVEARGPGRIDPVLGDLAAGGVEQRRQVDKVVGLGREIPARPPVGHLGVAVNDRIAPHRQPLGIGRRQTRIVELRQADLEVAARLPRPGEHRRVKGAGPGERRGARREPVAVGGRAKRAAARHGPIRRDRIGHAHRLEQDHPASRARSAGRGAAAAPHLDPVQRRWVQEEAPALPLAEGEPPADDVQHDPFVAVAADVGLLRDAARPAVDGQPRQVSDQRAGHPRTAGRPAQRPRSPRP